jgi:hypothetical protein
MRNNLFWKDYIKKLLKGIGFVDDAGNNAALNPSALKIRLCNFFALVKFQGKMCLYWYNFEEKYVCTYVKWLLKLTDLN